MSAPSAALSLSVSNAEREPFALGVNATDRVQLVLGAREAGQVPLFTKSCAFVPVMLTPVMFNAVAPVLLRVTVCGLLLCPTFIVPKFRLDGLKPITVADKVTCCGLPGALSVILSVAETGPKLPEKKTTEM